MKTYCLAVLISAAALTGIVATGASATTLCEITGGNCPAGKRYPVPQKFQATLATGTAFKADLGGVATVECNESEFAGETYENAGANQFLRAEIGVWELSHNGGECILQGGGGKCTVAQWVLPALASFVSAGGNGSLVIHRLPNQLTLETTCVGLKCLYAANTIEVEFHGGGPGEALMTTGGVNLAKAAGSNLFCPGTATVSFEYAFKVPANALWIAGEP